MRLLQDAFDFFELDTDAQVDVMERLFGVIAMFAAGFLAIHEITR